MGLAEIKFKGFRRELVQKPDYPHKLLILNVLLSRKFLDQTLAWPLGVCAASQFGPTP